MSGQALNRALQQIGNIVPFPLSPAAAAFPLDEPNGWAYDIPCRELAD